MDKSVSRLLSEIYKTAIFSLYDAGLCVADFDAILMRRFVKSFLLC